VRALSGILLANLLNLHILHHKIEFIRIVQNSLVVIVQVQKKNIAQERRRGRVITGEAAEAVESISVLTGN